MMQNVTFRSSSMCRKNNRDSFFRVLRQHRSSTFSLLLPVLFFRILDTFFSFAGHLLGEASFCGKSFWKSFKDCRIRCMKKRIGSRTRFSYHQKFQVNYSCFFGLSLWPPWLNYAHSGMVWKIFLPLHKLEDIVVLDQATGVDPQGQLQENGLRSWT